MFIYITVHILYQRYYALESLDWICQRANALDLAPHHIPGLEELRRVHTHAHTRRGAGGNDGARFQGHALRKLGNDMVDVKDLQGRIGILPLLAVDKAADAQLRRVGLKLVCRDDAGTDGGKAVQTFAEIPLLVGRWR